MMDWYSEAKMREQDRLHEAMVWHIQKTARAGQMSRLGEMRSNLLQWLGDHLAALGTRPQMQYK